MKLEKSTIRSRFIISYITLMTLTFCIIFYFIFSSWKASTESIIARMENDITSDILERIESFVNIPLYINEVNHKFLENGIIDISNKKEREMFFAGVMKSSSSEVYSFSIGTRNGEYYGARRNTKNEIELMRSDAQTNGSSRYFSVKEDFTEGDFVKEFGKFDPRTRDWYKIAKENGKPMFSPIYKHFVMNDLAISASYPIYDKSGDLEGVLGTHLTLSIINNYLSDVTKGRGAAAYIIERDSGQLVANSLEIPNFIKVSDTEFSRINVNQIDNGYINAAYSNYIRNSETKLFINADKDRLHMSVVDFKKDGLNWLIVIAVNENQFTSGIIRNIYISLFISIIAVIISVLVYIKSAAVFLKPIYNLIKATENFSKGDFSQRAEIYGTDEIGKLSHAFNKMAQQLHILINNLEERVKERTAELEVSEGNMRLLLNSAAEGIYGIDLNGNCTFCNTSCINMLGYKHQDELIGKNMHWQVHPKHADGTPHLITECKIFKAFVNGEGSHVEDEVFWRADGTCFPVEYFSFPQFRDGKAVGAVITFMDITERKISEEKILYLSYHDELTGLYNRRFFEEELRRLNVERNLPLTIVMADMNGLKHINDTLGHAVGDEFLKKAAEVISKGCRADDIVARFGGDEFIILLPKTDTAEAEKIINRIKDAASEIKIQSIGLSISFGLGTKLHIEETNEEIFKIAEDLMYIQKRSENPGTRG